ASRFTHASERELNCWWETMALNVAIVWERAVPRTEEPAHAVVVQFPEEAGVGAWRIWITDRSVHCDDRVLDLARCPGMLRLFKAFQSVGSGELRRETLLYYMHGLNDVIGCSERFLGAKRNNCVKMISRARVLADEHLSGPHRGLIEWFPYDHGRRVWRLV